MATSSHPHLCQEPAGSADTSPDLPAMLTTITWAPRRELAVADWVRQGRWLGALGRGAGWWIGDWLRYGNSHYGQRYTAAARATGYDVQSLMNMAYVAGRFEPPRRRPSLSYSHHAELAGLSPEDQDVWLDRAEAGGLSVRSLRIELRHARKRAETRRARAHARWRLEGPVAAAGPNGTALGGEPTAPALTNGSRRLGLNGVRPAHSLRADSEVVCPECGCHFAPRNGAEES